MILSIKILKNHGEVARIKKRAPLLHQAFWQHFKINREKYEKRLQKEHQKIQSYEKLDVHQKINKHLKLAEN
jgi:hypothetical protein